MARSRDGNKKAQILDAATIEIASRGFHKTTVAQIAKRAGVADGTIYLYFRNKEEVLFSLFDRAMGRYITEGQAQARRATSAKDKLKRIVELHLTLVGKDRELAVIIQVELRHSIHFMNRFVKTQVSEYLSILANIVIQGQEEGIFRADISPQFAANAIFGILDEITTDWVLAQQNTKLESRATSVTDFLLTGLKK